MFCKQCGAELTEEAVVCPKCGCATDNLNYVSKIKDDSKNMGFAVLGFFFPLIGFILWLVWKNDMPLRASSCGKGALIGVIIEVALWLIIVVGFASCAACYLPELYY